MEPVMAPSLPILVYDDACGVCTRAATYIDRNSAVSIGGVDSLSDDLRDRLPSDYEACAHLVTDEAVVSCGEAMARAFERTGGVPGRYLPVLRALPGYGIARDGVYRAIARNRPIVGRLRD